MVTGDMLITYNLLIIISGEVMLAINCTSGLSSGDYIHETFVVLVRIELIL
jgi:hypothetical protein